MPIRVSLVAVLALAVHDASGENINDVSFTKLQTAEQLSAIEQGDECYLVDFGNPPSMMFTQAARKFATIRKTGLRFALTMAGYNHGLPNAEQQEDAFAGLKRHGLWLYSNKANPEGAQVMQTPKMGRAREALQWVLGDPKPVAMRMDTAQDMYDVIKVVSASLKSQGAIRMFPGPDISDAVWMKNGSADAEEWKLSDNHDAADWREAQKNITATSAAKDEV